MVRKIRRTHTVQARCELIGNEGRSRRPEERLDLTYTTEEPHQVQLRIGEEAATWTFARDILLEAAHSNEAHPAGLGDVTAWRSRETTTICLAAPESTVHLEVPSSIIDRFLTESLKLVPAGSESQEIGDEELQKLISG